MERVSYLIALSRNSVEGGRLVGGEGNAVLSQGIVDFSNQKPAAERAQGMLGAFLERAGWPEGRAVLVLPTDVVSFRRLPFTFSDPKKIRQVLPFELESELMDNPSDYAYDFEIAGRDNGGAYALVYLVKREYLQGLLDLCESHNLALHRVTFAAQALVMSRRKVVGHSFHLYAGSDESFIAYVENGGLKSVSCLEAAPLGLLNGEGDALAGSPRELLEHILSEEEGDSGGESRKKRLQLELERVKEETNRFLRINRPSGPFAVEIEGLFANFFEFRPEYGDLTLAIDRNEPTARWQRSFFGILGDLVEGAGALTGSRGFNFFRRMSTWAALVSELKWGLVASCVLALLLSVLVGGRFLIRTSALESRMAKVDAELLELLKVPPPVNTITINAALAKLEERYSRRQKEQKAISYLEEYNYDTLILFRELSNIFKTLPQLSLEAVTFNRERFTMSGSTVSYNDSETLKNRIAELPQFKGRTVKVTHSKTAKGILYRLSVDK